MTNGVVPTAGGLLAGRIARLRRLVCSAPFETLTETGRASERHRRIALTALTSLGVRGCTTLTALVSVPLALHYLGMERYGMWVTIGSIVAMLGFADFGIGNGLLNAVASATGKSERENMQQSVASAFFLLCGTACLLGILFAGAYPWTPWAALFNVKSELARSESGPAMLALVGCFLLGVPLGIVQRIQVGIQEGFISDVWLSAGSLLSLLALLMGLHLRWGLPALVLAMSAAPLAATFLNGVSLFCWSRPWLLPRLRNFRWLSAKLLARQGLLFFLLQISYILSMSSDSVIIARVLGAQAVPQYAVTQRVFLLVAMLQNAWLTPLWPAYGEAIQRGDFAWVRRTLKRSIVTAVLASGALALMLVAVSRPLFKFWVGAALVPAWPLTLGLALWAVVQAGGAAVAMFLNGSNTLLFELGVSCALVMVGTPLKIFLCREAGVAGVAWGQLAAYLFVVALPFALVLPKIIARQADIRASEAMLVGHD